MKKYYLYLLFILITTISHAQINLNFTIDSAIDYGGIGGVTSLDYRIEETITVGADTYLLKIGSSNDLVLQELSASGDYIFYGGDNSHTYQLFKNGNPIAFSLVSLGFDNPFDEAAVSIENHNGDLITPIVNVGGSDDGFPASGTITPTNMANASNINEFTVIEEIDGSFNDVGWHNIQLQVPQPEAVLAPDANNILYVNKNVSGGNENGSSWANAVPELSDALRWAYDHQDAAWATTPLQIWVAGGTYKPLYSAVDLSVGNQNKYNSFLLVKDVQLYGGFAGTETSLSERDLSIVNNSTILSGDIGTENNNSDNTYHVLLSLGNVGAALIDGFTVTDGNASFNSSNQTIQGQTIYHSDGGGINIRNSSPFLTNINFTENRSKFGGGAMFISGTASAPVIHNSIIVGNHTIGTAGGVYHEQGNTEFINVTFADNTDSDLHRAINHYSGTSPLLINCIVWGTMNNNNNSSSSHNLILGNTNTTNGHLDATGLTAVDIFTDPANGDYTLKLGSPAVNTGSNTAYTNAGGDLLNDTDIAGNARVYDDSFFESDRIDMGAYEYSSDLPVYKADFSFSPSVGCSLPHTVFFTDQSTNPDTWYWEFGDGTSSTARNPINTYTSAGEFTVKLTVEDTILGITDTYEQKIVVSNLVSNFNVSRTYGCGPLTIDFTDASSIDGEGSVISWSWEFGDGNTSTDQNPSHVYDKPGNYTVSLTTTTSLGCKKTSTKTNFIEVMGPDVEFTATSSASGGAPLTVDFHDQTTSASPINSYLWVFGDGNTSARSNPSHTYTQQGMYDVSLRISDLDGCSRTLTKTNYINTIRGAFDVSKAIYTGNHERFSVSAQETDPHSLVFNNEGTKMFILGYNGDYVNEYILSTAFDVSTAVYAGDAERFSVGAQENYPTSLAFNNEGTKMFVMGYEGDYVNEYTLSTAFDVSTAVYAGDAERFSVGAQENYPTSLAFNNEGTKMFVMGYEGDYVNEYTLSTAFDVSTAVYAGDAERFSVSTQDDSPVSLAFNNEGTKMFVLGLDGADINEYTLSVAFDVSTAVYAGDTERFSVSTQDDSPVSLAFNNEGTKMFVMGHTGDDIIEYSLAAPVITGTVAMQAVRDTSTVNPFAAITVQEPNDDVVSATITLDDNAKGGLMGTGLSGTGPYTLASTDAASLQESLRALVFNPTENRVAVGSADTTTFSLAVNDGFLSGIDSITSVVSSPVSPKSVITSGATAPVNSFDVTITFTEDVVGFTLEDIKVSNGVASKFTATSASVYTASITPTADGLVTVDVPAAVAQDLGNSDNTAAAQFSIQADLTAPLAEITLDDLDLSVSEVATVTFAFSEPVTGFDNTDLTVPNGTLSAVSSSDGNKSFTAVYTPTSGLEDFSNTILLDKTGITDIAGNAGVGITASDSFSIDTKAPTLVVQNITVYTNVSGTVSINTDDIDDGSFDGAGIDTFTLDKYVFTCADIGNNTVTFSATDVNGNTSSTPATVQVIDTSAPKPDLGILPDIVKECIVLTSDISSPTATDNCSGVVKVTNDAVLPITAQGTTVITWTYEDENGNTSTQTQNVVIEDTTAPVADVATLSDITAQCEVLSTDVTEPTATDNCNGLVTVTNDATFPITAQGTTVITWTYTDENGNYSTQTQNVVIEDTTAPVPTIASLSDIIAQCEVISTDVTEPTATDNCGGTVVVTNDATFPITIQGTTVITWTYTDENGNYSTQMQNVVIEDTTAPVSTLASLSNITAQCEVQESDVTEPTATDNCGGLVTVTNDATFPITAQGTTVITWTYTDENGNYSTQTQNVVIEDTTAPVPTIASLSDITAQCEVQESDVTEPTATDNCGGTVVVTNDATFPITTQGTTVITWTYTDTNGNYSTQTQNVVIEDITAPVADVATLTDITAQCEVISTDITEPTATDNCGGTIVVTNDATFPITAQGTTVITWTYTDENGNYSTQTQNVIIEDTTAPVADITNLPEISMQCEVLTSDIPVPTATDNCSGTLIATTTDALSYTEPGLYTITWLYDDGNGNTTTQNQTITVLESALNAVTFTDVIYVYNTNEQYITVDNLPGGATVSYSITPDTGLNNGAIDAGTYNVTATVTPAADAPNCNSITLTATLTIEQAVQQIIFDELPVKNLEADVDFQLTATTTSGLPVYYTYTYTAPTPPATVTPQGWVEMFTSGTLQITAHQDGNANYLPADSVTQEQVITSSDSGIHHITIDDNEYDSPEGDVYYLIECGNTTDFVTVTLVTEPGAMVTPGHSFTIDTPRPGIYEQVVTITSQDGTSVQTYTITVEKMFQFFDVVTPKFDNVLFANNNPDTNGGYSFTEYEWYKNGELVSRNQYFSEGSTSNDLLDSNVEYRLVLTTVEGDVLQTCVSNILLQHDFNMTIHPNPAIIGKEVVVTVDLPSAELNDMQIDIHDINGRIIHSSKPNQRITTIQLPGSIHTGVYTVTCTTQNLRKSFKIIVSH